MSTLYWCWQVLDLLHLEGEHLAGGEEDRASEVDVMFGTSSSTSYRHTFAVYGQMHAPEVVGEYGFLNVPHLQARLIHAANQPVASSSAENGLLMGC